MYSRGSWCLLVLPKNGQWKGVWSFRSLPWGHRCCLWIVCIFDSLCTYILEKTMAPHSSTLAWKISWMEEPGRLQSMGSRRVGHDWATSLSLFTFLHWRRKWQPTPVFLPGESQGRGSLVAAVYGVTQSWTRLKRLSSSSSSTYIHTILSLFSESMNSCFKQMKIN